MRRLIAFYVLVAGFAAIGLANRTHPELEPLVEFLALVVGLSVLQLAADQRKQECDEERLTMPRPIKLPPARLRGSLRARVRAWLCRDLSTLPVPARGSLAELADPMDGPRLPLDPRAGREIVLYEIVVISPQQARALAALDAG